MAIYDLPELDATIAPPTISGRWTDIGSLSALAAALRIEQRELATEAILSIPDAWAQAQLFGQALIDPGHEAYKAVRAQWRGLLALFALQGAMASEYRLSVGAISLGEQDGAGGRFRRVLAELRPSRALARAADWGMVGVVRLHRPGSSGGGDGDGTPLALLSPMSLVAIGRAVDLRAFNAIEWLDARGIHDPLDCGLSADKHAILGRYARGLMTALGESGAAAHDPDLYQHIVLELGALAQACEARSAGALRLRIFALRCQWPQPFFAMMGQSFEVDPEEWLERSDCALALRPLGDAADLLFKSLILIDPEIADTFGLPATAIRAWEQHMLADALRPETLAEIRRDAAAKGHLVVTPADLTLAELVRLSGGAKIAAHSTSFEDTLLPLTPLALLLGDAETLAASTRLVDVGDAYALHWTLHVQSREGGTRPHVLRRRYERGETVTMPRPADLAIWPDFESPAWRWNFLRFQYAPLTDLQVRFGASAQLIARDIRSRPTPDASAKVRAMGEWSSPAPTIDTRLRPPGTTVSALAGGAGDGAAVLMQRFEFWRTASNVGEQHHLPLGVEAVFFARDARGQPVAAGCALVKRAPAPTGEDSAIAAIDFGSTNTIAYAHYRGQSRLVSFAPRVIHPVGTSTAETGTQDQQSEAYLDFMPPDAHETPFPTILKTRRPKGLSAGTFEPNAPGSGAMGVRHMIFFRPSVGSAGSTRVVAGLIRDDELISNIKWSDRPEARHHMQRFLRQTIAMTAAELVAAGIALANIEWRFSYPQAFDSDKLVDFRAIVGQALAEFAPGTGRAADFITEGEAAARYFTQSPKFENERAKPIMIMLDIGGGTTDAAIWFKQRPIWRGSIEIAGKAFFTNYLIANPQMLEAIDPFARRELEVGTRGAAETASAGQGSYSEEGRAQLIELLLATPAFVKAFDINYPYQTQTPLGRGLRDCAATALGGMLHYIGLVLRGLIDRGEIAGLGNDALGSFSVAFGGRGSQFFQRLEATGMLDKLCRLVAHGAGIDAGAVRADTRFSDTGEAKHEVARGLVTPARFEARAGTVSNYLPLGEAIVLPGAGRLASGEDVRMLPADLDDIDENEPAELLRFLDGLRRYAGIDLRLDGGSKRDEGALGIVRDKAANAMRRAKRMKTADAGAQDAVPPFIVELATLVKLMSPRAGAARCRYGGRMTEPLVWAALILSLAAFGFALWAVIGSRRERRSGLPDADADSRVAEMKSRLQTLEERVDRIAPVARPADGVPPGAYGRYDVSAAVRPLPSRERGAAARHRSERAGQPLPPAASAMPAPLARDGTAAPMRAAQRDHDPSDPAVPAFAELLADFNRLAADVRGLAEFEARWKPIPAARTGDAVRANADGKLWIVPDAGGTGGMLHALLPGAGTVRDWEKFYHGKLGTTASDLLGEYYAIASGPMLSLQRLAVVHGDPGNDLTLLQTGALSGV